MCMSGGQGGNVKTASGAIPPQVAAILFFETGPLTGAWAYLLARQVARQGHARILHRRWGLNTGLQVYTEDIFLAEPPRPSLYFQWLL